MSILYHNLSFEGSKDIIQPGSVDLFWLDPPYFISGKKKNNLDLSSGDRDDWDRQWSSLEDYLSWTKTYLELAYGQLKPNGSLYLCISWQNSPHIHLLLEECNFFIQNRITWKRDKGRGSQKNWKSMHEDIFFCTKHPSDYTFNVDDVKIKKKVLAPYKTETGENKDWWIDQDGQKVRLTYPGNLWDDFCVPYWSMHEVKSYAKTKKTPHNTLQKHNTQKPKDLVKRCILASSNRGDLVVDYFSGSGTTAIASRELDRNSVVFDINKTCIDILETRIKSEITAH